MVRKWFGHEHIPQRFAPRVNRFAQDILSPFLNFHRPCLFATETRTPQGKIRRTYRAAEVMTPYDRLRTLAHAEQLLKPGQTFEQLDALAHATCDLNAAQQVQKQRQTLFQYIHHHTRTHRVAS